MNEEIVIVVPGAKYIKSRTKLVQKLLLFLYSLTKIFKPVYSNYSKKWADKFEAKNRRVFWLHWSRGITPISRWFAKKRLKRLLKQYSHHPIKLVGISIGGEVILESIENSPIKKVILICSTNEKKEIKSNAKIINIFSKKDLFARLAMEFLFPFHGGQRMHGENIKNIAIPEMTHDEFCTNIKIKQGKYKGKRITELVNKFLE